MTTPLEIALVLVTVLASTCCASWSEQDTDAFRRGIAVGPRAAQRWRPGPIDNVRPPQAPTVHSDSSLNISELAAPFEAEAAFVAHCHDRTWYNVACQRATTRRI